MNPILQARPPRSAGGYAGDKANLIATGESSREADHTFPVSVNPMRCPSLHALPRVEETR
jgi:hypothetical protein